MLVREERCYNQSMRGRGWDSDCGSFTDRQVIGRTDNIEECEGRGKSASSGIVLWC